MKFDKLMIMALILFAILTVGAVNAADNAAVDDLQNNEIDDNSLTVDNDDCGNVLSAVEDKNCEISDDNAILSSNDKVELITVPIYIGIVNHSKVDVSIANATGDVDIIVDSTENIVPLNMGSASLSLKNVSVGTHSLVVVYNGDNTYNPCHNSTVFTIPESISSEFTDIVVGDDFTVTMVLKDGNGNVISNAPIKYTVNDLLGFTTTNGNGVLAIKGKGGAVITVVYEGSGDIAGTNTTLTLNNATPKVVKVASHFDIPGGVITLKGYAVDTAAGEEGIYYSTRLLDDKGNPIKGASIQFAVNDKIYTRTTLDDGSFTPYKLNMVRAGRYTMAFFFNGNEKYESTFASVCVDLDKKPITIKASAKSYKASATKSYTVTLSTIVGSSHDGKVHLSSNKKVTLTVNGKTFTGKTNSKNQVTFKLTNLSKKGTYTAKISFAGDSTYVAANKSVKITVK